MKKGAVVMIYSKPLTLEKPEGKATLVKRITKGEHPNAACDYWQVRFISDGFIADRFICP